MLSMNLDLSAKTSVWTLFYAENKIVKKIGEALCTTADIKRLIPDAVDASVPGNFERDLERAGKIADPYFGMNTLDVQKLENLHLFYCRSFSFEGEADENTFLHFDGIDTVAEIFLNGKLLKTVSNMFLPYDIPVKNVLQRENDLVVHILPAVIAARDYDIPVSSNALPYNYESLYIRKAASMFGWDIMPRIVSGGIWKPVSLIRKKPNRIDDVFLYTNAMNDDGASLMAYFSLHIEEDFLSGFSFSVRGKCGDSHFEMETEPKHTNGRISVWIENAKRWYPRNAGEPNLYDCEIILRHNGEICDSISMRTGIRMIELSRTSTTDKDGSGDFCFIVNGKRIFAMGTNWVPLDAFHSNDANRVDRAMEMADDIGCNIIRLWGGNVYECQRFFDICDEKGILVWSDFGMGCGVYPQERKFLEMVEPEFVHIIKANRNHPSLALWAGDNECDCAYNWAGTKRNPNTNIITRRLLPDLLVTHDFTRPYLPSSPFIDEEAYRSGKPTSEDHLWGPRDYFKGSFYKNTVCHFASETGYHGCPSPESLKRFISSDHLWPLFDNEGHTDKEWLVHAACMRADDGDPYAYRIHLMDNQVKTLFADTADNLPDFALMSQISQAEAKKYFIERFRITRGRRNGIIWWNLVDGWPQISDAVVDYYYTKKLAYHFIKRSQQPVLLAFDEPDSENLITLYGINDTAKDVKVSYRVTNMTRGIVLAENAGSLLSEKSTPLMTLGIEKDEKSFLLIEYSIDNGQTVTEHKNHYFTNIINIDYNAYKAALSASGMLEIQGF